MKNSSILFLLMAICSTVNLSAQTDVVDTLKLAPAEIRATREEMMANEVPASLSLVNQDEIQLLKPTLALEESLRRVPGVFVSNRHNLSQGERISIRGMGSRAQFGVRSIKMVLDGIPLTFPDGTTQLNNVDPSWIGRMEVLRGPSSTLYGNAAGGVIYMESETPAADEVVLTPRLTAGSYGFYKGQLQLAGNTGKTSYLISADGTNYNGYRDFSEARLYHLNSVVNYRPSNSTRLTFILNMMHAPYMYNPSSLSRQEVGLNRRQARGIVQRQVSGKAVMQGQSGIALKQDFGKWGSLNSTVYGIARELDNPIFGRIIDLSRWSGGTHNVYEKSFATGRRSSLKWLAGFDMEFQADDRQEFENPGITDAELATASLADRMDILEKGPMVLSQRENVNNAGLFSLLKYRYNNRLTLSAGIRQDWFVFKINNETSQLNSPAINFNQLSPSAGALYQFSKGWESFANYSTAFQTPTANEFSNDPQGAGFNQNLLPETVWGFEAGLRKSSGRFKGGLTAFYLKIQNQLIPYQASTQSDVTFYRNAGETSNRGLEGWLAVSPFKMVEFFASYTYMNYLFDNYNVETGSEFVQLAGNKVPGVPAHHLFTGIDYKHPKGLLATLEAQWIGEYFANDFNGPVPGATDPLHNYINEEYFLLDLRLGYKKQFKKFGFTIFGGINNILDAKYNGSVVPNAAGARFFEPAPGRNYYVGVEVPLKI
ncbi:MAG: TonB-dependent receptor [Bacteroidia bacterium]